ncbi:MAG TPA: metallophosphoesterase family protein [Usitatibacter sp.]|nr:metallophosphoesterase family protein [Usitatibacter sp.]
MRIGLISDTHGLLRPQAIEALRGSDHILHAGDIGSEAVLRELAGLAPIHAVRGNNDREAWARAIPEALLLELGGIRIHVLHDLAELAIDPRAEGVALVVSGHSHKPRVDDKEGVTFVNPGSAGPRRFRLPVTIARVAVKRGRPSAEIVPLLG